MKKQLYVDFHVLQTVPPSCVNRDDTGSPKTAVYGGTTRARVSSQAWKRAIRQMFMAELAEEEVGIRTKYVHDLLVKAIGQIDSSADADTLAEKVLDNVGIKLKKQKGSDGKVSEALFFMSQAQLAKLAELAVAGEKDKKVLTDALNSAPALDVALFGRMVANNAELKADASCQVAHSISTHTVHNEYDYFTAVDDCAPVDNAGAAHLDTIEFNSSTLYRYATICVSELNRSLGDETVQAVRRFAEAFIKSMPTGRQNSFANRTLPDFVYITVREDQPINLVGAFEKPVRADNSGYMQHSADALTAYAEKVYASFADAPAAAFLCSNVETKEGFAEQLPIRTAMERLEREVCDRLAAEVI